MATTSLSARADIGRRPAILGRWPAGWRDREGEAPSGGVAFEEEIFDPDQRRPIRDPKALPFRFICNLDITHPPQGGFARIDLRGSGVLISPRHVLTAAHNILDNLRRLDPGLGRSRAIAISAAPARNLRGLPFGRSPATQMRFPARWRFGQNPEFDFGLLTLRDALGSRTHQALGGQPLGFWGDPARGGDTRIRALAPDRLREHSVNISGYPSDKCGFRPSDRGMTRAEVEACVAADGGRITLQGSTQWRAFGRVTNPAPAALPRTIAYDLDTADGHSGSPVWIRWEGYRNLVAINTTGLPDVVGVIVASLGVRITDDVLTQLRTWMREDRVSPAF